MQKNNLLVWIDLEMTGLNVDRDTILEIATIVTDNDLNIIAQGPDLVIYQDQKVLDGMHADVKKIHSASGLSIEVLQSTISLQQAEETILSFLETYCQPGTALLCGNSVWMDKAFLKVHMLKLYNFFHYRIIDVSSIKELARRWYPEQSGVVTVKSENHRALEDINESIEELKYYRALIFKSQL